MKKILLLGGFGFIGTNILKFVDDNLQDRYKVIVFDKQLLHPLGLQFSCVDHIYYGDFADGDLIKSIFNNEKIDFVIHLLNTTVPSTSNNIIYDIESNVIPTIGLLNIMVEFNVLDIVYLSSGGAIYGNQSESNKHKETDNTYPMSSYGIVKLTIEKYLYQFSENNGINPLILRLSNPYGMYHQSQKQGIINIAIHAALFDKPFFVWGDGNVRKDYIYIEDFCDILFDLISNNFTRSIINVGSGQILTVNKILSKIKEYVPRFGWDYMDAKITDVSNCLLDLEMLTSCIGDYEFTPFEIGIQKTVNWIKS